MAKSKAKLTAWGKRLQSKLRQAENRHVKVGVLADAQHEDDPIGVLELAAIHEFGTRDGHVPERSFIRRTFEQKDPQVKEFCEKLAKAIVTKGEMSIDRALGLLGEFAVGEIRKTMTEGDGVPPPLSPDTIRRRKGRSTRPLVDTGQLKGAITYKVDG